jgi:hypothetical protein
VERRAIGDFDAIAPQGLDPSRRAMVLAGRYSKQRLAVRT